MSFIFLIKYNGDSSKLKPCQYYSMVALLAFLWNLRRKSYTRTAEVCSFCYGQILEVVPHNTTAFRLHTSHLIINPSKRKTTCCSLLVNKNGINKRCFHELGLLAFNSAHTCRKGTHPCYLVCLVSLFNGISTLFRLFNAKAILLEDQ